MDKARERRGSAALRAYVSGDFEEIQAMSAFKEIPVEERVTIFERHRGELAGTNRGRLVILESMLLPLDSRTC